MAKKNRQARQQAQDVIPMRVSTTKNIMAGRPTVDALGYPAIDHSTEDTFNNFVAKLGIQSGGMASGGFYNLGPFITRNRIELEAAYRDNWLVGRAVDCIAEDMTKAGVEFFSTNQPDDIQKLQSAISSFGIMHDLASTIKWARLYGGAIAVMLIDGADYSKPLNIEAIGKDKFKGLIVLDRWQLQPSMNKLITDVGKDMGKPEFYEVLSGMSTFKEQKIHHSRVLRFEGIELPYYQKLFENLWGLSVVERMLDRLLAFDSATQGAAQLLYKAYLRVIKMKGFREALAQSGKEENAVIKQFYYIGLMQKNEGMTVLDAEDEFGTHTYSFGGISDMLQQFGQQIAGACETPLVRLFGQSPSGFSTGDTDIRNYYDNINKEQESKMRHQLERLFAVMGMSVLGKALPDDFEFKFVTLWQLTEQEKSAIAQQDSSTIAQAHESGMISKSVALKELLQQSRVTGRFTNITDQDIKDAENELPPGIAGLAGIGGGGAEHEAPEDPNDRLGSDNPDFAGEKPKKKEDPEDYRGTAAEDSLIKRMTDKLRAFKKKFFDADFEEQEHPRKNDGKFAQKGAGESGKQPSQTAKTPSKKDPKSEGGKSSVGPIKSLSQTKIDSEGKRTTASGKPLPEHIAKLKIPPAWTEVVYSEDPKASFLVKGKDSKGRVQYLYSESHRLKKAAMKFKMIDELNKKYSKIVTENDANLKKKEEAKVLALIMKTGVRPGSEDDHDAEVKAYGATTLEGRHVEESNGQVVLHFIGKKGVENRIPVGDKGLAELLMERKKKAGDDGQLFKCDNTSLLKYSSSLDGGGFRPKDFRTLLGTQTAMELIKNTKQPPKNEKEYKKMVVEVAKKVAERLGNTPPVALKSYISPVVWADWKIGG